MNRSEEDYVKVIYELSNRNKAEMIKTNVLAEHFGYTDQSVNEMVNRLQKKGLLDFVPYKGVALTPSGEAEAIRMIRSHRIWEVFLSEKLHIPASHVHEDAEMLEHATSDHVLKALYDFLGKPKRCQHGNPIPDFSGMVEIPEDIALSDCDQGDVFILERIRDADGLLQFLEDKAIRLSDRFEIQAKDTFNHLIELKCDNRTMTLSLKTARMLFGRCVSA
ncbi:MAG: metal-dependent transcriptional regulator [Acholeplasmataceae bacterium]|nr:metal-dependent transcriptional regulator [Acholeplasmataceae bacterium]